MPITTTGDSSNPSLSNLAAALSAATTTIGEAQKNNTRQTRQVLQKFVTVVNQFDQQVQTQQSQAPSIPEPAGTSLGDLKNGIGVFGKGNTLNIAYIVALVLELTSQESLELAKEQELQVKANQLQYSAGLSAAEDAATAAYASAAASFTSAGLSLASVGFEALGSFRANAAANKAVAADDGESPTSSLSKEQAKTFAETPEGIELQPLNRTNNARSAGTVATHELEANLKGTQQVETEETAGNNARTNDLSKASARKTQASANQTLETQRENVEQETSFNSPADLEPTARGQSNVTQARNVAATEATETKEGLTTDGKVDQSPESRSTQVRSTSRPADPESNQRVGDSQENRVGEENKAGKSKAPADLEPTARGQSNATQARNVAATEATETKEGLTPDGKVDQSPESRSTEVRSTARPADPESNQRVGDSQENRVGEENKAGKSKAPSDFEKLVKDLREAIKPDLKEKLTELQKQQKWDKAYDRAFSNYGRIAHSLNSAAQAAQGIGGILQGQSIRAQLIAQAQAQLEGATSQAAGQTVQQLQEVINNARNLVNGLLQSEFSVSRSA